VIVPEPAELHHVQDASGANVAIARFAGRSRQLAFESRLRLDHAPVPFPADADDRLGPPGTPFAYDAEELPDLTPSIAPAHADPQGRLADWTRRFAPAGRPARAI